MEPQKLFNLEDESHKLAEKLNAFAYDTDPYTYNDMVEDYDLAFLKLKNNLINGDKSLDGVENFLKGIVEAKCLESETAKSLLKELSAFRENLLNSDLMNQCTSNEPYESSKYEVRAYYSTDSNGHGMGLADEYKADHWSKIEEFSHNKLCEGLYIEIKDYETGLTKEIDPDAYLDTYDGEFVYKPSDFEVSIQEEEVEDDIDV